MTAEISSNIHSTSSERKRVERVVNGDLRLKIVKIWENDAHNYFIFGFDRILADSARQITYLEGINYEVLSTTERLVMARYRCPACGVLPLYSLDLKHLNKARCGKCSMLVGLKNSGKYGKIRKKVAISTCRKIDEMLNSN